ncbi:hypothetical protein M0802_004685 [Mischocyttarus mexicanus]|nr:hypothetical protein M0802_004685 [Mischocyttarus mexicanus]
MQIEGTARRDPFVPSAFTFCNSAIAPTLLSILVYLAPRPSPQTLLLHPSTKSSHYIPPGSIVDGGGSDGGDGGGGGSGSYSSYPTSAKATGIMEVSLLRRGCIPKKQENIQQMIFRSNTLADKSKKPMHITIRYVEKGCARQKRAPYFVTIVRKDVDNDNDNGSDDDDDDDDGDSNDVDGDDDDEDNDSKKKYIQPLSSSF